MTFRKNRFIVAIMVISAICIALTSCGTENSDGRKNSVVTTELEIFMHIGNSVSYKPDYPVFKKAEEITGIRLKSYTSQSTTDSAQAYNIMMATGKPADIVNYTKMDLEKFAYEGAFLSLNDLIDEHAPNIKRFIEENPEAKRIMTSADGNIYIIPNFLDGIAAKGWYIRQDWLDNLGLNVPKTVDEYYNVLKAFRERDPNGNNKKDEIPFFNRDQNTAVNELLPLFGVRPGWDAKDGVVTYGQYSAEYKNAMIQIAKWYKEGLIDQEIFTRGGTAREKLLGDNVGGSTNDWLVSTAAFNDKYQDSIPDFRFSAIEPPADINGNVWETSSRGYFSGYGWSISAQSQYAEKIIKYFDFWFTEEGRRLQNFGIEGEQYEIENGKPVFKKEFLTGDRPALSLLNDIGAQLFIGYKQDFWYEEQIMDPVAKEAVSLYSKGGFVKAPFPSLTLLPDEKRLFDEKWGSIDSNIKQTVQRWVLGAESVETGFEPYMEKMRTLGMDEITAVYQQAYDRFQRAGR